MRNIHRMAVAMLVAVLAGCGGEGDTTGTSTAGTSDASTGTGGTPSQGDAAPPADAGTLRQRAQAAMRDGRIHAPAGDSAIDHWLALRTQDPRDAAATAAIVELQPYLLIAAEQALAARRLDDAARLVDLLRASDPAGPALQRLDLAVSTLRADLAVEQARADAAEDAAARAPVQETVPASQAAASSTVASATAAAPSAAAPASSPAATQATSRAPATAGTPAASTSTASPSTASTSTATAPTAAAMPPSRTQAAADTAPASPAPDATSTAAPVQTTAPVLLASRPPRYPAAASARRIEGRVRLLLTVGAAGQVTAARVISAEPAGVFDESALATVRQYRFDTGADDRKVMHTIAFSLRGAGAD